MFVTSPYGPGTRPRFGIRGRVSHGLRGISNPAVLGAQIVCEAKSWLGTVEVPAGSNSGGRVDELLKAYFGSVLANPWCVVFAWVPVVTAIQKLGGTSQFPGAKEAWGNARKTLELSRKAFRVDTLPAVGAVFFRTSTTPGDGSSGHMGIVIGWDNKNLLTIEGNQGSTNKVDVYTYTATATRGQFGANGANYPFEFIHVEETPISATATVAPCTPSEVVVPANVVIQPTTGTPTQQPSTPTQPTTGTPTQQPSTPTQPTTGTPTQQGTTSTVRRTLPQNCKTLVVTVPSFDAIPHWDDPQRGLSNRYVAADIVGAHFESTPEYYRRRNGAATRLSNNEDRDGHSGFGMFTDAFGNVFYVSKEDNVQYGPLKQYGLWGRDAGGRSVEPYVVPLYRYFGGGSTEKTAEMLQGMRQQNGSKNFIDSKRWKDVFITDGDRPNKIKFDGFGVEYKHPLDVLRQINKRFPRPFLFLVYGEPYTAKDFLNDVVQLTDVIVGVAGAFGPLLGFPDLGKKLEGYQKYRQAALTLATSPNIVSVFRDLLPLAETVVPASVRPYLQKGATVYDQVKAGNYVAAAQTMGVDTYVMGQLDSLIKSGKAEIGTLEKIVLQAKDGFNSARGTVQNLLNLAGIDRLARQAKSGTFFSQFADDVSGMISKVPVLRDVLVGAGGDVLLSSVPRVTEIARAAITEARDVAQNRLFSEMKLNEGDQDVLRGLVFTGLGIPAPPGSLEQLAFHAVAAKAEEAVQAGLKSFTLPASVPPEKKECYAIKIREEKGITVLVEGQSSTGTIKVDTVATKSFAVPTDFGPPISVNAGETVKLALDPLKGPSTVLPPVVVQSPSVKPVPIVTTGIPSLPPVITVPSVAVLPTLPIQQTVRPQIVVGPTVPTTSPMIPLGPTVPVIQQPTVPAITPNYPAPNVPVIQQPTVPAITPNYPAPNVPVIQQPTVPAITPNYPAPNVPIIQRPTVPPVTPNYTVPNVPIVQQPTVPAITPNYPAPNVPTEKNDGDCGCGCGGTCGCDDDGLSDKKLMGEFW